MQNVSLPQLLFSFIWVRSSFVAFCGHFQISERYLLLKCSWHPVFEVERRHTAIDGIVSQMGRPGKH